MAGKNHSNHEDNRTERVPSTISTRPVSDFLVARALELFRRHPERRWTVEQIAEEVGTSRAVLGRRFAVALSVSPLRALRNIRMDLAAKLLRETDEGLASIGDAVGYDSEFAFSRAFFQQVGMRPGRYRALHRSSTISMAA